MIPADFNPHRKLSSRAEAQLVLDETIEQCNLQLRIFDDRGAFYGFERKAFALALSAFLTRDPRAQATLIMRDTTHLEKKCPRVLDLLKRHAPQLRILCSDPSVREFSRGIAVGDHGVLLSRPHFDRLVTFVDYDEQAISAALALFSELESQARPGLSGHVTGL